MELHAGAAAARNEPEVRDQGRRTAIRAATADRRVARDAAEAGGAEPDAARGRSAVADQDDRDAAQAVRPGNFQQGGYGDPESGWRPGAEVRGLPDVRSQPLFA